MKKLVFLALSISFLIGLTNHSFDASLYLIMKSVAFASLGGIYILFKKYANNV